ncbi:MAG TPA: hypothetical protein VMM93_09115 [Vicinamibacterales bacterium]|nr:hypothetical protein [Vicinamibacterales bacterium]
MAPLAGYSGTPLVRKLGIKPGTTVALLGAPPGFARTLGDLPAEVRLVTRLAGSPALAIWFVGRGRDLDRRIAAVARQMGQGLWIAWPKRASGVPTDVTGARVRAAGLAHGLVDYKVCAIDSTWSGLKFARRRTSPAHAER